MVLRTDYADGGATPTPGNITASDINAISATANAAAVAVNGGLTNPMIDIIRDTNGATILDLPASASAVNYLQIRNNPAGFGPSFKVFGSDTNAHLYFEPRGSGAFVIYENSGQTVARLTADGSAADIDVDISSKSAGVVKANGVPVVTTTNIQTLTNKTVTGLATTDGIAAANLPNGITNGNTARQSQAVVSGTSYYITGSNLNLPATLKAGMAVGTRFRWRVAMDKTAAGTGAFAIEIRRGTNGTTADTADVSQSVGTQTAVIDNMVVDVEMVVTTTGATGAYYWTIVPVNTVSSTTTAAGFGVAKHTASFFAGTVSSVAMNTASLKFGLSFKATTGTPTITIPMVQASAINIS